MLRILGLRIEMGVVLANRTERFRGVSLQQATGGSERVKKIWPGIHDGQFASDTLFMWFLEKEL